MPDKFRDGAISDGDLFPDDRKGCLEVDGLKNIGIKASNVLNCNALKFLDLILPIHCLEKNEVPNDPRKPFYAKASYWSNLYKAQEWKNGLGYGHKIADIEILDLIRWDGAIFMDGVLGGSDGAILRRFDKKCKQYNVEVNKYNNKSRFLEIKRFFKLNDNQYDKDFEYEPAHKDIYIYDVIGHNVP